MSGREGRCNWMPENSGPLPSCGRRGGLGVRIVGGWELGFVGFLLSSGMRRDSSELEQ